MDPESIIFCVWCLNKGMGIFKLFLDWSVRDQICKGLGIHVSADERYLGTK
jgi:hypothetical protein